jgi:hypothetical protein
LKDDTMNVWAEILPIPFGTLFVLLAQAASTDPVNGWVPVGTSVVTAGILAWYVIYDVRVRTPAMQKAFQDELEKTRSAAEKKDIAHQALVDAMRAAFLAEQAEMRKAFAIEQAASRSEFGTQMHELRQMAWQAMQSMRGAVHDVRDTANVLMLKGEVEKKLAEQKTNQAKPSV